MPHLTISHAFAAAISVVLLSVAPAANAKSGGSRSGHDADHTSSGHQKAQAVQRNAHGKIARSPRARAEFKRLEPCPSTGRPSGGCPGYVIDHVIPLKRGGADRPFNMQWQSKAEAREKDRWE